MPLSLDSYDIANQDFTVDVGTVARHGVGQSFLVSSAGYLLYSAKFLVQKIGSPTGTATVTLYAHTGTYGVDGLPTGSVLATSDTIDVSTITASPSFQFVDMAFTGAQQVHLTAGTHYFVVFTFTADGVGDYINIGCDASAPSHGGNMAYSQNLTDWTAFGADASFDVSGVEDNALLIDLTN